MPDELIKTDSSGGILTVTLARSDKKNALIDSMYGAMADALEAAENDPSIRVVLLQSEGDMFTAGNDVGEFAAAEPGSSLNEQNVGRFLRALANSSLPLVAAVQGRAVGVGTTLLLHCDFILLADNALLSAPFVNLALVPEAASSLLMPARVGYVRAFELFALGELVDARTAVEWGLANRVVALSSLHAEARTVAERIARQPAGSLMATKRLMRDPAALTARMFVENEVFSRRLQTAEAREAFSAFAERRAPDFLKLSTS
ncbi:enoyl-CoA hydratase [Pseudomonas sp. GD04087]|uniref:enoyl-CoA hydratase n=1 Tax=unclassified Pseudomonas TaxID=196821 RepID=UPI00244C9FDF|nr:MULTISPECIES: enoyl-CoA hydratase [unclassified Pseudomonas]MDH0291312.1 enoyl-CoA hydratase [Pseudomonas sp. GD04087]MDH1052668.1 enoyl-CoA hydratase [Pseudomonas sp. GD03903]MDH2001547.1 enoyl-CoA hydratase [Pseudomonas sp. GD03691]